MRSLYDRLRDAGVRVAVITGRPASQRAAAVECLKRRGFEGWDALVTRTPSTQSLSSAVFKPVLASSFKHAVYRRRDQVNDMAGGRLKYGFLLSNPMYYLP